VNCAIFGWVKDGATIFYFKLEFNINDSEF